MKLRKAIGDKSCEEEGERDVAVVEEDGKGAVFGKEKGGADGVRVDDVGGEIHDGFVEKREETVAVLIIMEKSFDICGPMSCCERAVWEGGGFGTREETIGSVVGGQEEWAAIIGGKVGGERPKTFLCTACEGGAVKKKDVEFCWHFFFNAES